MRWVKSCLEFIARCTEEGEFVPWDCAHLANISGNFRRDLPPYYEIGGFYENTPP